MIRLNHIILKYNIVIVIVFIFSIFICGCETVKTRYVDENQVPKESVVRIVSVFLKNGEMIDVKGKNAKFEITGDSKGITYDSSESKKAYISYDSIAKLKIEIAENNYWMPLVIIGGVITLIIILYIIIQPSWKGYSIGG